jgi:dihydrofolate reductase
VRQLTDLGLVDEYHLLVHPVALGAGVSLFSGLADPAHLALVEAMPHPSGVVKLVYRKA